MAEFTEIGRHCAAQNCNQQDFLPFKCDCCEGTFCLPHRSYSAHACASSGTKDFRALVCPLCKKTVRFADSEDPDEQWDLHTRTDCRPGDYNKKPPKKRCSAPSCREVLGPTNTQQCARCGKETCLSHRYPDSHSCTGAGSSRGNARSSAAAAAARRMEAQRPMSLREKAAQKRAAASNNTARASADRRRRATPVAQEVGGGARGQGEQCPQCEASFRDVGSLVAHVEAFHSEVLEYRDATTFKLDSVKVAPSDVHGHGLMTTRRVAKGAEVFTVDLPDCGEEQGYTPDMYDDYAHIAHKDGESAALIDAGSTMEGNLLACHEDVKMGYIRAMNHARGEPGANVLLDIRGACVPKWYFPAGGVTYNVWVLLPRDRYAGN